MESDGQIENNFTYHSPENHLELIEKYRTIRNEYKKMAYLLKENCPQSRELSVAMTNLETSMFWANAAIARN